MEDESVHNALLPATSISSKPDSMCCSNNSTAIHENREGAGSLKVLGEGEGRVELLEGVNGGVVESEKFGVGDVGAGGEGRRRR